MRTVRTVVKVLVQVILVLALLAGAHRPAEARRSDAIQVGTDILDVGPLDANEGYFLYDRVGIRYERLSVFSLDLWRWDKTYVIYRDGTFGTKLFEEAPPELLARLDLPVPWRYYLPPGLLLVLCLVELAIIARKKRPAKLALTIGIGITSFAIVLYLLGFTWEFIFPLLLGGFHVFAGLSTLWAPVAPDDDIDAETIEAPQPLPRPSEQLRPPPPNVETDPFRAPPQPPPIVVRRPETARPSAPVVHDEDAEAPKLLR